jgi:puromycin-sensitive aminopeptidase
VPRRYELSFDPDLESATFTGEATIAVEVLEPTTHLVLNALDLEIDEAWFEQEEAGRVEPTVSLDSQWERATLVLPHAAVPGPARVHLRFRGVLNDKLRGFYRSTFTDIAGGEHTIATTHFESTDARRAFPCWDEPDLKAVFAISLVAPEGMTAISNASEIERRPVGDERVRVQFADTMPMSTYLVAFVVGPLEVTEPIDVDGVPLRIVCPPGKRHLAQYALEVGAFSLRYFSDYFAIPYPSDKLDLVAIPDFAFGAMENLGCVTFRETLLLVDPEQATQLELQNVVHVIAHEIAHMWFGDLVTMKWWNGIWLNEAFATLMEEKCADAFRPEWDLWTAFALARSTAYDTDALMSTRPVEFPVVSPAEADGMFDVLTYEKGGSVLRMLELYLGEERFRDGIRSYVATHSYGNTETTDLWDAIEEATGEPVRRVMDSWIFQGGHPVIGADLRDDGKTLHLDQHRFTYNPGREDGATWGVPMLVGVGHGDDVRRVLFDDATANIDLGEPVTIVRPNAGAAGFFRVRYSPALLRTLATRAQDDLDAVERYSLVDDTWASVLAGTTPASDFLDLVQGFRPETNPSVWKRISAALGTLSHLVADDALDSLRAQVRAVSGPALERLGDVADDEDDSTHELRGVLLELMGTIGDDTSTQLRARELLAHSLHDQGSVEPNLAAAALRVVATIADLDDFERILARFRAAATPQEKQRSLFALALVRAPELFDRLLAMSLGDEVRSQDGPYLLRNALLNARNNAAAWRFVRQSWSEVLDRFPDSSIARLLEGVRSFTAADLAADVESFLAEHAVPQGEITVAQHLERMRVSVALAEREGPALTATLSPVD